MLYASPVNNKVQNSNTSFATGTVQKSSKQQALTKSSASVQSKRIVIKENEFIKMKESFVNNESMLKALKESIHCPSSASVVSKGFKPDNFQYLSYSS